MCVDGDSSDDDSRCAHQCVTIRWRHGNTNICFTGCAIAFQVIFLINYTVIKSEICSRLECAVANGIYLRRDGVRFNGNEGDTFARFSEIHFIFFNLRRSHKKRQFISAQSNDDDGSFINAAILRS